MRLSAEEAKICQNVARQFPEFVEILNRWRSSELDTLPYAANNLDVMRGRVQTLTEMQGFLQPR
jgi:hypothetical protein